MRRGTRWQWVLEKVVRRPWFRLSVFSALAVAAALLAPVLGHVIPDDWPKVIGANAVDGILEIIASSMLAVTVFSLTAMVSTYAAASSSVNPRAIRLLIEDPTAQNALATFIGAFLFSLVGIISLSTDIYGANGRVVLFAATLLVIATVVVTLLRWIEHLSTFGRVGDTTQRVERATEEALAQRRSNPRLGGACPAQVPPHARPVFAASIGYVRYVDMVALAQAAGSDATVHVEAIPGTFADPSRPLAWASFDDATRLDAVRDAFTVGAARTFDQDPRFGLLVLSEIASRALSPAINDPGTAISVIGTLVRVLADWRNADAAVPSDPVPFPRVHVASMSVDDLFEDAFAAIARDGAGMVEVCVRLQKALAALARAGDAVTQHAARRQSARSLEHALSELSCEADRRRVSEAAAWAAMPMRS